MRTRHRNRIGPGINPNWDKQPEEVKQLLWDNLPMSKSAFMIITPTLFFVLPIINSFLQIPYFILIHAIIIMTYAVWLIISTFHNYKKKTEKI